MELGPIWRAILRNKGSYALIALQIAVTMAVMVNSIAIMQERSSQMGRPSGTDEDNILTLRSVAFVPDTDHRVLIEEDLAMLRGMPGVIDAVATNSFPLRGGGWSMGLSTESGPGIDGIGTAIYFSDEHAIDAYGKLDIVKCSSEWLKDHADRKIKHICWDGCMFSNELLEEQQTWNTILDTMLQVRDAQ